MRQILLKTPRGNTAVIPVDHFVSKANAAALSGEADHFCEDHAQHSPCRCRRPSQTDEDAAAIAAAIDTTRILEQDDIDKEGKEQLLYELIGASKRRDVGRKRNVRTLYKSNNDSDDDRMDIDNECDGKNNCCSQELGDEEHKVATKFDGIDINSDEYYRAGNFKRIRRRFSTNSGACAPPVRNTMRQAPSSPFSQHQQQQHSNRQVFPGSPASSSQRPPLMVAFYHEGRKVSLDRIWEWITGSSTKADAKASNNTRAASLSASSKSSSPQFPLYLTLSPSIRLLGGIDRQNRVGSKFGGGGVSSSQNAERERKERLKQLALESIDLAKDPYLMRNHLGTYECKLCLTLHTNEANYLAHTQGKKHQAGLAKRAHMEKLRKEREEQLNERNNLKRPPSYANQQQSRKTIKIGRPAYQVFKSRDTDTQQRCLTFELTYKDIKEGLRPRHRFMSAFEQRVDLPRDKRYQYVLFAAEPYETIAFKIPNEALDRDPGRLITHWDEDDKKFTVTLYFADKDEEEEAKTDMETEGNGVMCTFAPALGSR
eukprot:CAMPEP_0116122746 /NCGR_PEP_ID=MMETSP0329-20121206/4377_1 /TAXON_ID=697910 /ORGANISM="Pseudo-nitzschia arenysensis, Strain B593" /LENGTH=541 /DNA_ID=CAMNT_0003616611 /DNA_START=1123 /DNA_END=2748 /DNA_ORIENTATION=-